MTLAFQLCTGEQHQELWHLAGITQFLVTTSTLSAPFHQRLIGASPHSLKTCTRQTSQQRISWRSSQRKLRNSNTRPSRSQLCSQRLCILSGIRLITFRVLQQSGTLTATTTSGPSSLWEIWARPAWSTQLTTG